MGYFVPNLTSKGAEQVHTMFEKLLKKPFKGRKGRYIVELRCNSRSLSFAMENSKRNKLREGDKGKYEPFAYSYLRLLSLLPFSLIILPPRSVNFRNFILWLLTQ